MLVCDRMKQEVIQNDQFPFEILLHPASILIIILLFKRHHAFKKLFAVEVANVVPVAGFNTDCFSQIGLDINFLLLNGARP